MIKQGLNQVAKVKYAVLNAPYLIPIYMKPPYNPMITKTTLNKMLNRSIGLEIECFGSLAYNWWKIMFKDNRNTCYRFLPNQIAIFYGIEDYYEDNGQVGATMDKEYTTDFNEHKIRISNYKQLIGLYDILEDMKTYCRLNNSSGCHVHVDITDLINICDRKDINIEFFLRDNINLNQIERIFYPELLHYTGEYNNQRKIEIGKAHLWVAIRVFDLNTLEFRIAPMTFEYTEIIGWYVKLTAIINNAILNDKRTSNNCFVRNKRKLKIY